MTDVKVKAVLCLSLSRCSHAGIVNVVKDAIDTFSRPVYMVSGHCHKLALRVTGMGLLGSQVVGGLHLAGTELVERIPPTVDFLSQKMRPSPAYILPMHCSGFAAKIALEEAFGEGCVPTGVGNRVIVEGSPESENFVRGVTYQN